MFSAVLIILSLVSLTGCNGTRYVVGQPGKSVKIAKPVNVQVQSKGADGKDVVGTYAAKPGDYITPSAIASAPIPPKAGPVLVPPTSTGEAFRIPDATK